MPWIGTRNAAPLILASSINQIIKLLKSGTLGWAVPEEPSEVLKSLDFR